MDEQLFDNYDEVRMKTSKRQLDELVEAEIDPPDGQVMWGVREHYCRPLTLLGMCDQCSNWWGAAKW